MFGGSLCVVAAQSIFENFLRRHLSISAPSVDPTRVLLLGATNIRGNFPDEVIPGIIAAYVEGIKAAFIFATVLGGIGMIVMVFGPWKSLLLKPAANPEAEAKVAEIEAEAEASKVGPVEP
jgi:MFS transporter, DHA2 family, glioxin efflux transporter